MASDIKIKTYDYRAEYPFNLIFKFEIREYSGEWAVLVPKTQIFMGGFTSEITEDMARHMLYAYMNGHDKGIRNFKAPDSMERQIYKAQHDLRFAVAK